LVPDDFVTAPPIVDGHRGYPADDIPEPPVSGLWPCADDGWDIVAAGVYVGLADMLEKIKAGGVVALLVRKV
jgi:hypothetical protein